MVKLKHIDKNNWQNKTKTIDASKSGIQSSLKNKKRTENS